MTITKEQLINALNKDVEWEYAAAIQYIQHASTILGNSSDSILGKQYKSIIQDLMQNSNEEMKHAFVLSEQIRALGGIPTVNVEKCEVSEDSLTMLKQDLARESESVKRYRERIAQANELGEDRLSRVLDTVLAEEESHESDLITVLETLPKTGA